jgi:predicted  nucleic acid-binding Zn-ribbon protein
MLEVLENLKALQELELGAKSKASADIEALRKKIPEPILAHYDRLMDRGKKGLSMVRNGVCAECHLRLAIGVLAHLRRSEDIQLCDSCGRYLCLAEEAPAPAPPPAPKKAPGRRGRPRKKPDAQTPEQPG